MTTASPTRRTNSATTAGATQQQAAGLTGHVWTAEELLENADAPV